MLSTTGFTSLALSMTLGCLAAAGTIAGDESADLTRRLESLQAEFRTLELKVLVARRNAKTPEEQAQALQLNPWEGFRERFDAIAFEASGTEVAAGAWSTIFSNELRFGEYEQAWEAFRVLVYDHTDSVELEGVVSLAKDFGSENADVLEGLQYLREASARKAVRAGALFGLASLLETNEASRTQALDYYREVIAKYGDVDGPRATFREMAEPALFEAEFLQVGMHAPDVSSSDETGTAFQLSDYEGKVVLLDFWGFW